MFSNIYFTVKNILQIGKCIFNHTNSGISPSSRPLWLMPKCTLYLTLIAKRSARLVLCVSVSIPLNISIGMASILDQVARMCCTKNTQQNFHKMYTHTQKTASNWPQKFLVTGINKWLEFFAVYQKTPSNKTTHSTVSSGQRTYVKSTHCFTAKRCGAGLKMVWGVCSFEVAKKKQAVGLI